MGEYINHAVSEQESIELENLYNNGQLKPELKCSGRLFLTNGQHECEKNFLTRQNPEFEYKGERYVRVVSWVYILENGNNIRQTGKVKWVKVEPITFEITNWDDLPSSINPKGKRFGAAKTLEVETEECVMSGIPFHPDWNSSNCAMWQNSLVRVFLNSGKSEELDGNPDFDNPYKWDFSKTGWLYEALNMTREPTRQFVIPAWENEIADHAFEGCVGLEKIVVPSHVTRFGSRIFAGLVGNTQVEIQTGAKSINFSEKSFEGSNFKFIYLSKDGNSVTLANKEDENLEKVSIRQDFSLDQLNSVLRTNYRQNLVQLKIWREEKQIKFIPPEYTLDIFPSKVMKDYFVNNNNQRWGKLVKTLGFDTLEGTEKNNSLTDLLKVYYAIGGFSKNQGESEKAFEYILNYVAVSKNSNVTPKDIGAEIHARFSKLSLRDEFNPMFAQFFMKYYKDNPDFMNFRLKDKDGDWMDSQDYLCNAHNSFSSILKNYPNRVVNGNEERALLTPRFVAEHSSIVEYDDVEDGNELLAELIGKYGYDQEQFDEIQEIYEKAKKIKDKYVIMADKAKETDCVTFRVLDKDDPLGFVLGDITNCCQHIGGVGAECVDDGYTNPNAGFIVFEESLKDENGKPTGKTRVLAQAYIWYDPQTKTVCYDNIEIPAKVLHELRSGNKHGQELSSDSLIDAVVKSADAIMSAMNKNGVMVERVTTGEGYNDLQRELSQKFVRERNPKAKHRNYSGYTDADSAQFIIRTYDQTTKAYAEIIRDSTSEISQDLQGLEQQTTSRNL